MKQKRIKNWSQRHYGKVALAHGKFFISFILFISLHSTLLQAEELSGKKTRPYPFKLLLRRLEIWPMGRAGAGTRPVSSLQTPQDSCHGI